MALPGTWERPFRVMTFNTQILNNDISSIAAEIRRLGPGRGDGWNSVRIRKLYEILRRDDPFSPDDGVNCQFGVQLPILLWRKNMSGMVRG
jgi:hypothetical protein